MKVLRVGPLGFLACAGFVSDCLAETKPVAPATPEAAAEWALSLPENARIQALQGVLNGWAQTDAAAAATWSRRLREQDLWAVLSIVSAWAYQDPGAAAGWVAALPEGQPKTQSLESLGSAWATKNRVEAMAWATKIEGPENRQAAMGGIVQSWAMQDAAAALQFAREQSDAKLKEQLLGKVIHGWCFKDRPAAEKWVKELPEGDLKTALQKAISSAPVIRRRVAPLPPRKTAESRRKMTLNFETPPELAKILQTPLNQARQDAILRYVQEWFGQDKEKATQWIPAKLRGYVLGKAAGSVAREWSHKDLPAAAEWVRQIPPFFRDFVAMMGREWATEHPKEVAEIALKWPEDSRRQVILRGVGEAWAQKDPSAALAWIQALPPGATRTGALKGFVIGWSQTDASGCRAWMEKIQVEEDRKEARHYFLHGLARSKPSEAIAYLGTLAKGDSDENLFYCLAKEWALADAPAAAEWAKSLPEGSNQEAALQAVLRQWVYTDAVRAAGWVEKLPGKKSRTAAFDAMMEMWVEQNPKEALAWAQGIKEAEPRSEAVSAGVRIWSQSEPKEALDWVNQLPEGKDKSALLEEATPPRQEGLGVGELAPDFTVPTLEGKSLKLSDFRGKFILLDFWATWCGPCTGETPNLKEVFGKYGKREDFVMIGLSLDSDSEKPKTYLKENACGWIDGFLGEWGKDKVTKKYGVRGIPAILLIGPDGKVVANHLRGDGIMAAVSAALGPKN